VSTRSHCRWIAANSQQSDPAQPLVGQHPAFSAGATGDKHMSSFVVGTAGRLRLAAVCLALAWTASAGAAELPLTRVVLSSSGLAQFIHSGPITGGSTIQLPVRLDQVDDILKSLTIFDKEGSIGTVSLPGKTPLAELFRDLPFGPDALNSSADLLNALVGSEVEIAGQVAAKGRVFRVQREEVALPNNAGRTTRHRLTLMTDAGIVQAILEEVTALRFTNPETRAQIERLLAGLTENRAKDRRVLSIGFLGSGTRNVAISYVVAAPVWKTAYRMVLPKEAGKARLQGWAVLENLTGGDWKDVELLLVSGNPVALRQALYTAFFADRVEVPVTAGMRVMPRTDDAVEKPTPGRVAAALAPPAPAPGVAPQSYARAKRAGPRAIAVEPSLSETSPPPMAVVADAAEAEEASTQLVYRFPVKLSLATGHTMMVPFVDREVSAARTWLYQPETAPNRPLAAVRVRNDGESGLPAGIVTAFDVSADGSMNFVGDALLPLLPKATFKLVTFALDSKTNIRREDRGVVRTTLGKAVNGTLTLTTRSRRTIVHEVTPPGDEDREVIVEEERFPGWVPSADTKGVEETPTRFRYKVAAPKGQTTKANLVLERVDNETVALTTLAPEDMLARIRGLQNESAKLKDTVAKLAAIVADINKAKSQQSQLENEREKITGDQERIRANLQAVGQSSDLGRRYLGTLKSQEDRLAEITRTETALEGEIGAKTRAAEELVKQLTL
jgi:hypothetical protein